MYTVSTDISYTVLSQVKDFLPHLANANTRLKKTSELDNKTSGIVVENVENASDDEKEHVEMVSGC